MGENWLSKSDSRRYTLGVVYEPDVFDAQDDMAKSEDIENAAWEFARKLQGDGLTKSALVLLDVVHKALNSADIIRLDVTELIEDIEKGGGLNDMHTNTPWDDRLGDVVETYIAPIDMNINGETVRKGTWLLGVVWSSKEFEKVKRGERVGYSMEGKARRVPVK